MAEGLASDFRTIVADRLRAVVVFGVHATDDGTPTRRTSPCGRWSWWTVWASRISTRARDGWPAWSRHGLATPLVIARDEFARSLDAFPIEFGAILARHAVVTGVSPFDGLAVKTDDLRRACEVQARSHLLHLREGYLETGGNPSAIHALVARSAAPLMALLVNVARIDGVAAHTPAALARVCRARNRPRLCAAATCSALADGRVPAGDAARLYPAYLDAVERLAAYVDRWSTAS